MCHTVCYCDIASAIDNQVGLIHYYHDLVLQLVGPGCFRLFRCQGQLMELEFMRDAGCKKEPGQPCQQRTSWMFSTIYRRCPLSAPCHTKESSRVLLRELLAEVPLAYEGSPGEKKSAGFWSLPASATVRFAKTDGNEHSHFIGENFIIFWIVRKVWVQPNQPKIVFFWESPARGNLSWIVLWHDHIPVMAFNLANRWEIKRYHLICHLSAPTIRPQKNT